MEREEQVRRLGLVGRAFSPSRPVADKDLFAGRIPQLDTLVLVHSQAGRHALIYGVRGAGKTSLARTAQAMLTGGSQHYYVCSSRDTFESIWRGIFSEVIWTSEQAPVGFGARPTQGISRAADFLPTSPTPQDVVRLCEMLASANLFEAAMFVVDEFDRPVDKDVRREIADTVKILADRAVGVTIVLVGVADSVEELLQEHQSIQRSLTQVEMPPMTNEELHDIIVRGMSAAEMTIVSGVSDHIIRLSLGLPYYTHLLAQGAARSAVERGSATVEQEDFEQSLSRAIDESSQSIRQHYHRATFSNRETLYKQVLLACAMAQRDEMGTFGAPDVREQLRRITKVEYEIPAFSSHLKDFSSPGDSPRGGVLQRVGTTRRFRYKFRDPLMPTYVLLRGQQDFGISSSE